MVFFIVPIACTFASSAISVGIYKFIESLKPRQDVVALRKDMIEFVNDDVDVEDAAEVASLALKFRKVRKHTKCGGLAAVKKAVEFAITKVGYLADNAANRMVISKTIRDYMVMKVSDGGLGMRNHDVARSFNVAVTMYFLPNYQATLMRMVEKVRDVDVESTVLDHFGLDGSN